MAGWNKGELFFLTNVPPVTLRRQLSFQQAEPDYEHDFEDAHLGFSINEDARRLFSIRTVLVHDNRVDSVRRCVTDSMVEALQPPYSAVRHDAGCRGAGVGGLGA